MSIPFYPATHPARRASHHKVCPFHSGSYYPPVSPGDSAPGKVSQWEPLLRFPLSLWVAPGLWIHKTGKNGAFLDKNHDASYLVMACVTDSATIRFALSLRGL
ncbi:MAG: hypothetical protein OEZ36_12080 [Spirochaetota bacterium]|nr:hypothetical protein [Spirochaetota bacterium]